MSRPANRAENWSLYCQMRPTLSLIWTIQLVPPSSHHLTALNHSPPASTSWSIICDKTKFSIAWENKRASGKLQHVIRDISLIGRTTSGRCGSQMSKHLHTHTNTYIHINTHMQTHRHLACPIFTLKWKCNKQVTIKNSMTN